MTRETYAVLVIYPALMADLIWPNMALHIVVALAAAGFLYCQGRILYAGRGIPAWRVEAMPSMLVVTGLFEGAGCLAVAVTLLRGTELTGDILAMLLCILASENARRWYVYRRDARMNGIGPLARREIERITPTLHLIGHAAPVALGIVVLTGGPSWALACAGLAAVAAAITSHFFSTSAGVSEAVGFILGTIPKAGDGGQRPAT